MKNSWLGCYLHIFWLFYMRITEWDMQKTVWGFSTAFTLWEL